MSETPDPSVTERVALAIYDAPDPLSGDCVGDVIYASEHLFPTTKMECSRSYAEATKLAAMEVCRAAANAAISSMPPLEGNARLREWIETEMVRAKDDQRQARVTGEAYDLGEAQGKMLLLMELRAALSPRKEDQHPKCKSCGGLNTSCPEGCERDPATGELCDASLTRKDGSEGVERAEAEVVQAVVEQYCLGRMTPRPIATNIYSKPEVKEAFAKLAALKESAVKDDLVERLAGLHDKLANCHPSLSRGQVWCRECGRTQKVNSANALRSGWPRCCGYTMTIDSPEEQATPEGLTGGEA